MSFIGIIGILEVLAGIVFLMSANSAIHEIEGLIAFGFGVLTSGMAVGFTDVVRELKRRRVSESGGAATEDKGGLLSRFGPQKPMPRRDPR